MNVEALGRKNTVLLTTFRKDGRGVRTPVWVVHRDGKLYVRTGADAAKVKRIRRDPRVEVTPATITGSPMGPPLPGTARILEDGEWIDEALSRKYRLQKVAVDFLLRRLGKTERAWLEIELS